MLVSFDMIDSRMPLLQALGGLSCWPVKSSTKISLEISQIFKAAVSFVDLFKFCFCRMTIHLLFPNTSCIALLGCLSLDIQSDFGLKSSLTARDHGK